MIAVLMALVSAMAEQPAAPSSEIEQLLAQAGLIAGVAVERVPMEIVTAVQDYREPARDVCCHTLTPITIGSRTFGKGIGAHSNGRIVVSLKEPAESFHAWVGIDRNTDTGTKGSAIFLVLVDGQERYVSPVCRGGEEPHEVNVDLSDTKELTLIVGDAGDGITHDQADWAEATVSAKGQAYALGDLLKRGMFADVPASFDYDGVNCWQAFESWPSETAPSHQTERGTEYRRTWKDPNSGFAATLTATVYDAPAAFELRWELQAAPDRNGGMVSGVRSVDFAAPAHDRQVTLLTGTGGMTGSLSGAFEPTGFKTTIGPLGSRNLGSVGGRSSNGDLPFFILTGLGKEKGFAVGLAWSGQWKAEAAYDNAQKKTHLVVGMDPCRFRVPAGERIVLPGALFVPFEGGTQAGSNALRRALHTHIAARLNGEVPLPVVSFNSWFTFENRVNEQMLCELADAASGLGLEYFCLDSGWFDGDFPNGVGNWTVNAAKFPNGLRAVSDHVREKGMKFGLWFEPERVADGTRWQREHPEWLLGKNLLNLGEPGARALVLEMMSGIINEAGVDWIRYDFNIDPLESWIQAEGEEQQGLVQLRYIDGLYAMLDELMKRHPNLFIEQCSSGGRRIDVETIRRGHTFWKSDDTKDQPLMRFHETGGNMFIPGGFLNTNYCEYRRPDDLLALFAGPLGFGLDFRKLTPEQKEEVRRIIAAYKEVRRFINEDHYPLFEQSASGEGWIGWQFIDPKTQEGFVAVYHPESSPYDSATIALRGITAETQHTVKNLLTGETLGAGVSLTLPGDTAQVWTFRIASGSN